MHTMASKTNALATPMSKEKSVLISHPLPITRRCGRAVFLKFMFRFATWRIAWGQPVLRLLIIED
jgi:hypothetical protein